MISKPLQIYLCRTFPLAVIMVWRLREVHYCAVRKLTFCDFECRKAMPLIKKKSIPSANFGLCSRMIGGRGIFSILLCINGLCRTICPSKYGSDGP